MPLKYACIFVFKKSGFLKVKSVCLSGDVRRMQLAFLAQFPREMSQTDRIHPRYFLL